MTAIDNPAGLGEAELKVLASLTTLESVVRWAFSLLPPRDVADIVVQDEFSHDVVISWTSGRYLVFDTT